MKPENASVFDSPMTSGLRKAGSLLGLTDPSNIMQVGAPMAAPISDESHPAVQALLEMLHSEPQPEDPSKLATSEFVTSHRIPAVSKFKIPSGMDLPSTAAPMARPEQLDQLFESQKPFYAQKPGASMQAVRSLDELGDITPSALPSKPNGPPPPSLALGGTGSKSGNMAAAKKLNPDAVRAIRELVSQGKTLPDLLTQYPNVKEATMRDVITGGSWNWVK
jgi:hypothetical protein